MILSMTGFAATSREFPGGLLSLEIRSVNHRYLDLQMRLPEELRVIEPQLRELISAKVSRGKLECRVGINQVDSAVPTLELNQSVLQRLIEVSQQVREQAGENRGLSVGELMRWPGVMKTNELAPEVLQQLCTESLTVALKDFNASRSREGEKLKVVLEERIAGMEAIVVAIKPKLPAILDAHMSKLSSRLQEALGNIDEDRLKQEFALFAQKIDVDEELARLSTHLSEVRRILKAGGQSGKRLDFLMQELNREANTLGSKSVSTETTQASVELKVLIEQMREQIQNIE
ncbi:MULTISPECIES: YicC/YloC family endoribonuclease [Chromobacterium]|uniref:YicC family protein n=2 Tax=Chromobacterium TaxID=535 RepID=A0A1W0CXZ7_9NEIS|nr:MULTISPECIES: YicC/YloC family endoribonuclease [Chromobacterium]AXT47984.1 YicC family protein [Chromobacterium rhizoryzae]MBK0415053.1 YicC family protein [Chromobacterium haemolyticum]MBO0416277.1 YicC family protein [Chromobacterium haemolyticum]MBO0499691.1 YicC family protein [Chromobacterium haemolyticum]MDH0342371.1 YicC family protein [Chromobacterium haemolyticum]